MAAIADTQERSGAGVVDGVPVVPRARIDLATLLGLIGGFSLIGAAMAAGGSFAGFVDIPSLLIVFGGTLAVTTICFSLGEIASVQRVIMKTVFRSLPEPREAALLMLRLCEQSRRGGLLSLQTVLPKLRDVPFLHRCLSLVVDGTPGADVERLLKVEIDATHSRHTKCANILRRAAEIAPAMGLIGTLVGLVQMLGALDDPGSIGPAMAVALLTTFYGAILGSVVCTPLAAKLERNANEEALINRVYLLSAPCIGARDHPGRLQTVLNTLLPPAQRVRMYD